MNLRLTFFLLSLFLGACQENAPPNNSAQSGSTLTVSAAVSLKDAFTEIGNLYESESGATINFNFGASGALQKQIETGAPADVFASAGEQQMNRLAAENLIDPATRRDFARNSLVLIVPPDSNLTLVAVPDLSQPEVQKIAVGNPKTVPAGEYTAQIFERLNLKNNLQSKLIFAEDVRQVLDYVVRGEVDAGIVYASDAQMAGGRVRVAAIVSEETHEPILYPIALVKNAPPSSAAQQFINLILSSEGQRILQKHGFAGAAAK